VGIEIPQEEKALKHEETGGPYGSRSTEIREKDPTNHGLKPKEQSSADGARRRKEGINHGGLGRLAHDLFALSQPA